MQLDDLAVLQRKKIKNTANRHSASNLEMSFMRIPYCWKWWFAAIGVT
ncbi:hypothetical protein ACFS07_27000 [Undibacterium arcticum]